jgi:hypothetical protein
MSDDTHTHTADELCAQATEMDVLALRVEERWHKVKTDLSSQNIANKYKRAAIMLRAGADAMDERAFLIIQRAKWEKTANEAEARVKVLEEAALAYMAHTNSGVYRDKTGMRPEPSPQYERLFGLLHPEARAALGEKL